MDDIFHEYTAGELLKWLSDITIDEYIDEMIEEVGEETIIATVLDIEKIKTDFVRSVKRYSVVKRGKILYIHDNKRCQDILSWHFDDDNYEYVQNTANETCQSLNNRTMRFTANRHKCHW